MEIWSVERDFCQRRASRLQESGWIGDDRSLTFDEIGGFILAHRLERLTLHLALELWGNTKEVDGKRGDSKEAGENGEDLGGSHGVDVNGDGWFLREEGA